MDLLSYNTDVRREKEVQRKIWDPDSRGAEASLLIVVAAGLKASANFNCLNFFLSWLVMLPIVNGDLPWTGVCVWDLAVQAHCLSEYSHHSPFLASPWLNYFLVVRASES